MPVDTMDFEINDALTPNPQDSEGFSYDDFIQIWEDYSMVFPNHPGFNMLPLTPGSDPYLNAASQMLECLMGERSEPVTDESIGAIYPEGADL